MTSVRRRLAIAFGAAAVLTWCCVAHADDAFYKNKRLTILINFAVGGPTDIEGRLFAKYIGRHIDGQPTVIVQNMDGAGGIVGAKYLGEVAPNDGSMVGYFTGTAWKYAQRSRPLPRRFQELRVRRYQSGTTIHFMRTDVPPGMKEADRHRQGAGRHRRRALGRQSEGHAHAARARHARRAVSNMSPAIARARRRASRCRRARSTCSRNRRRAIAASSSRAW